MKKNKNVLVITGHPDRESFSASLAKSYAHGAGRGGFNVTPISLPDLTFDPILWKGYKVIQDLEPDLIRAQDLIKKADHIVFAYPIWWGVPPALLKGFIDRIFIPGFAFEKSDRNTFPRKLLVNKSARLLVTMDSPSWYYRWITGRPGHAMMKKGTLEFCGIKPVGIAEFTPVKTSSPKQRERWLQRAYKLGLGAL